MGAQSAQSGQWRKRLCRGLRGGCVASGRRGPLSLRPCAGSVPPTSLGLRHRARADHQLPSPCLPSRLALSMLSVHRVWLQRGRGFL